tara:strand:+ start:2076 stop:2306 length:231 start_codon:yes stop_codon:yes gene_type:complete
MSKDEIKIFNDALAELSDGMFHYETLNETYIKDLIENKDWHMLVATCIPLACFQRANEKLQKMSTIDNPFLKDGDK